MADTHELDYEFWLAEGPAKLFKISLDALTLTIFILVAVVPYLVVANFLWIAVGPLF